LVLSVIAFGGGSDEEKAEAEAKAAASASALAKKDEAPERGAHEDDDEGREHERDHRLDEREARPLARRPRYQAAET
jgi:hypothetical protein